MTNALAPAKLLRLEVNELENAVNVIVEADQLSLAIGKKGQNARLTAKLTGWKVDIQKDEADISFEEKVARAIDQLATVEGIGRDHAEQLVGAGFLTLEGILAADIQDLVDVEGFDADDRREGPGRGRSGVRARKRKGCRVTMRIYELAKELMTTGKELLALLQTRGCSVKSTQANLTPDWSSICATRSSASTTARPAAPAAAPAPPRCRAAPKRPRPPRRRPCPRAAAAAPAAPEARARPGGARRRPRRRRRQGAWPSRATWS